MFACQLGFQGQLTRAVLREAGPSGSAPARRPATAPGARNRAPRKWEVAEEEEDLMEDLVSQVFLCAFVLVAMNHPCVSLTREHTLPCKYANACLPSGGF